MFKNVALIGLLLLLLGGCSSKTDAVYQNSIQKGLDSIAEDNFSKAEGLFEMALEAKERDAKAKAYLKPSSIDFKADDLIKQNKIDDAVQSLEESITVKGGSKSSLPNQKTKKKHCSRSQENQKKYNSLLTKAKSLNKSAKYKNPIKS